MTSVAAEQTLRAIETEMRMIRITIEKLTQVTEIKFIPQPADD